MGREDFKESQTNVLTFKIAYQRNICPSCWSLFFFLHMLLRVMLASKLTYTELCTHSFRHSYFVTELQFSTHCLGEESLLCGDCFHHRQMFHPQWQIIFNQSQKCDRAMQLLKSLEVQSHKSQFVSSQCLKHS